MGLGKMGWCRAEGAVRVLCMLSCGERILFLHLSHSWGGSQAAVTSPLEEDRAGLFCGGVGGAKLIKSRRVGNQTLSGFCIVSQC